MQGRLAMMVAMAAIATAVAAPAAVADTAPGDNGRLAYTVFSDTGGGAIMIVDPVTGEVTEAFNDNSTEGDGVTVIARDLSWAPRGGRIAFEGGPCDENGDGCYPRDLFTVAPDGSGLDRLTTTPDISEEAPDWSPDGSSIAFVRRSPAPLPFPPTVSEIWVHRDGAPARLSAEGAWDEDPAWSPDGTRIAFSTKRDGNSEIYVMNADGTNAIPLTDSPETDRMPAWSPDGANIAWVVGEGVEREIWRMPAGGGDAVQLTDNEDADVHPSWSPDGSRITFISHRVLDPRSTVISVSNIWTMNADGTDEVPETDHPDAVFVGGNVSWERINRPPTASVAFQPITRTVGDVATFAVAAADSDGTTAAPQWDLDGDGEFDDATGVAANLQLTEDREYTVRVRVVDDEGAVAFASSAIRPTPVVRPVVDPPAVPLPRLEILGVRASSNALPRALRRGLALRVTAAGAVRATVSARLLAPLGRRLGLRGPVGSGRATLTDAGSQRIVLRFSPRARRLLAQRSRVTLIVTVRAIDGDGDVVRLTKRVTLRR